MEKKKLFIGIAAVVLSAVAVGIYKYGQSLVETFKTLRLDCDDEA